MGWWTGLVSKSPHGANPLAMSHQHSPSKLKRGEIYLPTRRPPGRVVNFSSRRSNNTARRDRSVSRRLEEPLEAELVVLFGTTSLIILVPWIVKDPRFLIILPMAVFLIPGLLGTCKEAFIEIVHSFGEHRNGERFVRNQKAGLESKSRDNSLIIDRYRHPRRKDSLDRWQTAKSLSQKSSRNVIGARQRTQFPVSDMQKFTVVKENSESRESKKVECNIDKRDYIKQIPFFKHWGGFL